MDQLRSKLIRLAYSDPKFRPHLLPILKIASAKWVDVRPRTLTPGVLEKVWDMYVDTYRAIGVKAANINEMVSEYDHWSLAYDGDNLFAFATYKTTLYGLKAGFFGSDGSPEGKFAVKARIGYSVKHQGVYAEVSHAVEHLAVKFGAPVVCAVHAANVLGKRIHVEDDGVHYTRPMAGIGMVTKVLVGNPRSIPTTNFQHPDCPMEEPRALQAHEMVGDSLSDHDMHSFCLLS